MIRAIFFAACVTVAATSSAYAQYFIYIPSTPHLPETLTGDSANIQSVAVISVIGQRLSIESDSFLGSSTEEFDISD